MPVPVPTATPQKENFLESLDKRRDLINGDIKEDRDALTMLSHHTSGLKARVQVLKNEKISSALKAQEYQYKHAADKLKSEVNGISKVAEALAGKLAAVQKDTEPLRKLEFDSMTQALAGGKEGDKGSKSEKGSKAEKAAVDAAPPAAAAAAPPAAAAAAPPAAAAAAAFRDAMMEDGDGVDLEERPHLRRNRRLY